MDSQPRFTANMPVSRMEITVPSAVPKNFSKFDFFKENFMTRSKNSRYQIDLYYIMIFTRILSRKKLNFRVVITDHERIVESR